MAEKKIINQEQIMQLLDKLYEMSTNGVPKVSQPVTEMADNYLEKHKDVESAAKSFIKYQIAKCTTSGFITGLGGIITLPITIPANVSSVMYVQMRMISALAYMGGFDTNSDQVQTLVYACMAGISIDQIVKNAGIQFGLKFTTAMVQKIPGTVLTKINQKVGFRFLTKFGTKGIINIGKMVPVIGGVVSGGFDLVETKIIADRAYKMFIKGDWSVLSSENCEEELAQDVIEIENFTEENDNDTATQENKKDIKTKITEGGKKTIDNISGFFNKKKTSSESEDVFEKIKKLSELKENGIITEEEFETKKSELLSKI